MPKFLGSFNVLPALPEKLEKLRELAYNLHWTWNQDTQSLFRRLDRDLWNETHHNPVIMLGKIRQSRLVEVVNDEGFLAHLNRAYSGMKAYLSATTWYTKKHGTNKNFSIVYFSAEFGLTECLQTYSGGLGILAGDHLKSASDLGIPLTGVGLLYKEGYFQQYLNSDGWQQERYEINDFENQPMKLMYDENKKPYLLSVSFPGRDVFFQIWNIQVGRISLYLLDTNVAQNNAADRKITQTLYGGNIETRIQQEIILGIGGTRAVLAMGIKPAVCHMNEGHSAFLSLERIRNLIAEQGLSFKEALELGYYTNIFTTHTPVPAGIDVFSNELVEKYFGNYYRDELKLSDKEFYALGTINRERESTVFNMAHLAMNTAGFINGVSKLHSVVSKKMWAGGFKNIPFNEIPIDSITNGVHVRTHLSREMEELFFQYLGEKWVEDLSADGLWKQIDKIPDGELWRTHERRRERLVAFARRRLTEQIKRRGGSPKELQRAAEVLDPTVLTIGFARRFATYKRATLIFKDMDRLLEIIGQKDRPVQFIIAGKAHPKDEEGKGLIQEIYQMANEEPYRKKIVFLENYDMDVARHLVQGCDVWLNNPRRPLEASGTSGMKVIANGGLNFSILDGWWDEAFDPNLGFKIGNREEYEDTDEQDEIESRELYNTLEKEIVPLFYDRSEDKLPRKWITMVKNSMKTLTPVFSTHRMVKEYFEKFYYPSFQKQKALTENNCEKAKTLAAWKQKVINNWNQIQISNVSIAKTGSDIYIGDKYVIDAQVHLTNLAPEDIEVQIYHGPVDKQDDPGNNAYSIMKLAKSGNQQDGIFRYTGSIVCQVTGMQGYTIRIFPKHQLMIHPFELGLVFWAS